MSGSRSCLQCDIKTRLLNRPSIGRSLCMCELSGCFMSLSLCVAVLAVFLSLKGAEAGGHQGPKSKKKIATYSTLRLQVQGRIWKAEIKFKLSFLSLDNCLKKYKPVITPGYLTLEHSLYHLGIL